MVCLSWDVSVPSRVVVGNQVAISVNVKNNCSRTMLAYVSIRSSHPNIKSYSSGTYILFAGKSKTFTTSGTMPASAVNITVRIEEREVDGTWHTLFERTYTIQPVSKTGGTVYCSNLDVSYSIPREATVGSKVSFKIAVTNKCTSAPASVKIAVVNPFSLTAFYKITAGSSVTKEYSFTMPDKDTEVRAYIFYYDGEKYVHCKTVYGIVKAVVPAPAPAPTPTPTPTPTPAPAPAPAPTYTYLLIPAVAVASLFVLAKLAKKKG